MKFPHNLDYSKRLVIETSKESMTELGLKGVGHIPLEQESRDSGISTSIVKYEPGAFVPKHDLAGGEELFVLEGVYGDELGVYPAGTYIRNPAGKRRSSFSKNGCKLFLKRNQFQPGDSERVVTKTTQGRWFPGYGILQVMPLFELCHESTALVKWPKGAAFVPHRHDGGEEILVLEGTFIDDIGEYPKGTWIRSPHLSSHNPAVKEGCTILVKNGHLLKSA